MNTETIKSNMLGEQMFEMQQVRKKSPSKMNQEGIEGDGQGEGAIIKIGNDIENMRCQKCEYMGEMNEQMVMGCVAWSWLVILFLLTVIFFFVPFLCNMCKDKLYNCPKCGQTCSRELARCL